MSQTVAAKPTLWSDSVIPRTDDAQTPATPEQRIAPPHVVRVGNAYARTVTPGRIAIVSVVDDVCLNDVSVRTARDIHTALGQLLGLVTS